MESSNGSPRLLRGLMVVAIIGAAGMVVAFAPAAPHQQAQAFDQEQAQEFDQEQVLRGRQMVLEHGCGGCHGGLDNPAGEGWLVGLTSPAQQFPIGACALEPGATPCFLTRPRNLTPDNTTGLGRFSERQVFNALRYGLRPGETADVEITSSTPGEGNFPLFPKYLAPPMPWTAWRHIADEDLWAIAAYLKHGLKPVDNKVEDSEGPPDFWEEAYADPAFGTYPAAPFPTANEATPSDNSVDLDQVLRGRQMVIEHACGDCHGSFANPAGEGWLAGVMVPLQVFPVGPCLLDPADPCFMMRPRNLTPDPETGLGRVSARQVFNALRYGLRPGEGSDIEVTADNFPADPDLLGEGMPWMELRHMADEDLWAIAAYLKYGVKAVSNEVEDSDRPPEGWAHEYAVGAFGTHPVAAFPTANEVGG